jgi:hypothetical protein
MSATEDLGRFELKYALPIADAARVRALAEPHTVPDPHAQDLGGQLGYAVHSLYFDTPRLDDYSARLGENQVRHRTRIRTYGQAGSRQPIFLENKRKLEDQVVKLRTHLGDTHAWAATGHPAPWQVMGTGVGAARWNRQVDREQRSPLTLVHYHREIHMDPAEPRVRLTLDTHIRARIGGDPADLFGPGKIVLMPPDWMVLELKFDRTPPAWMRTLVRTMHLRAEPISKFGMSLSRGLRAHIGHELRYFTPRCLREPGQATA